MEVFLPQVEFDVFIKVKVVVTWLASRSLQYSNNRLAKVADSESKYPILEEPPTFFQSTSQCLGIGFCIQCMYLLGVERKEIK